MKPLRSGLRRGGKKRDRRLIRTSESLRKPWHRCLGNCGFRVAEVEVNHRPRIHGRSKYGVERFVKGFLDLLTVKFLTGYGQRPLHVFGSVGLLAFGLGAAGLTYLAGFWIVQQMSDHPVAIGNRPLLLYSLGGLLLGAQLLSIGFVAELMTAHGMRAEPAYSIAEQTPIESMIDS